MRNWKFLGLMIVGLVLSLGLVWPAQAAEEIDTLADYQLSGQYSFDTTSIRLVGKPEELEDVSTILNVFEELLQASNDHSLNGIIRHYSPTFISGDNFNLKQIQQLIEETWEAYPDIHYKSQPLEIRFHGDYATIETFDIAKAIAPPEDYMIKKLEGKLVSKSRSLLFFKRIGDSWEITSDDTIWEEANIRYGIGEDVKIILSAPEQVKAGESYSAVVKADIPEDTFTIATISNQILEFPHPKVDGKFRALARDSHDLQRVMKANKKNRNEIVTATLGLTNVLQSKQERPSLSVNGIATIVKRVNVVPITSQELAGRSGGHFNVVRHSADGRVDLSKLDDAGEEDYELELVQPPDNN